MNKLEWKNWQSRFDIYLRASTEGGRPSEQLGKTSLQSKVSVFWHEHITKLYGKEIDSITCWEFFSEINQTHRIQHPICRVQADLFRTHKADGNTARRQYGHIRVMARYAVWND